ncbi:MAG: putative lipid II flippase FtsW [Patescibacteria group bacterium]
MKRLTLLRAQTVRLDRPLLFITLGLLIFGLAMVFDASVADATRTFQDKFFYLKRQLIWAILGAFSMFILSQINYKFWQKAALWIFIGTIILLVLVLVPGVGVTALGASRRLNLGFLGLQPGELAKLAVITFLSTSLVKERSFLKFASPVGVVSSLILLQPDMGTTVIIALTSLVIYFASGTPLLHIVGITASGLIGSLILALSSSYRKERLMTFLNPHSDPADTSYHVRQILIAIGSGGLWGLGLGQSRQKHLFLPEPATDSIFAIIAEELGFFGGIGIILAFLLLVVRGYQIASRTENPFGRLLAIGITSGIAIQAFINLAAMVALVPLTGIPLPLISYGGSSLFVTLSGIGILLNIAKRK